MQLERACNLDVPSGATPMTIADAILRELDSETLEGVLYYIDCFLNTRNTHNRIKETLEKQIKAYKQMEEKRNLNDLEYGRLTAYTHCLEVLEGED